MVIAQTWSHNLDGISPAAIPDRQAFEEEIES
jgi:hypothetical protein